MAKSAPAREKSPKHPQTNHGAAIAAQAATTTEASMERKNWELLECEAKAQPVHSAIPAQSGGFDLSPEEEKELTEIYHRIDRELAVEEARADRLLQQRANRLVGI